MCLKHACVTFLHQPADSELLFGANCVIFAANWIVDGTDSSERLILNVCRDISRVDADVNCPHSAAVCLVSEYCFFVSVFG